MSDIAVPSPEAIRGVVRRNLPGQVSIDASVDHLPLADVAGLDSIDVVEVILECEKAFHVTVCEALLQQGDVSVGSLIEAITRASVGQRPA